MKAWHEAQRYSSTLLELREWTLKFQIFPFLETVTEAINRGKYGFGPDNKALAQLIRSLNGQCTEIKAVTSCSTHKIDQQETDG